MPIKKDILTKVRIILPLVICIASIASPPHVHAGILADIVSKFRSIMATSTDEQDESPSSAKMDALHAESNEHSYPAGATDSEAFALDPSTLSAKTGSLRSSTEDYDFPSSEEISVYEVKEGDTLDQVATLFKVSKNTIIWANDIKGNTLKPGTVLVILPISGLKYTVKSGDTLASISKKYKADEVEVALFNGLVTGGEIALGTVIIVPEGEITVVTPRPAQQKVAAKKPSKERATMFLPVVGIKTQGLHGHNGVDIASPVGRPVYASLTGTVIVAKVGGDNGGYGNMVIIMHANGVQTVYAHLNSVNVRTGDTINRGEQLGSVGNTGRSTGPHLHFEVRGSKNPF